MWGIHFKITNMFLNTESISYDFYLVGFMESWGKLVFYSILIKNKLGDWRRWALFLNSYEQCCNLSHKIIFSQCIFHFRKLVMHFPCGLTLWTLAECFVMPHPCYLWCTSHSKHGWWIWFTSWGWAVPSLGSSYLSCWGWVKSDGWIPNWGFTGEDL